jgi:hypothetical protein
MYDVEPNMESAIVCVGWRGFGPVKVVQYIIKNGYILVKL